MPLMANTRGSRRSLRPQRKAHKFLNFKTCRLNYLGAVVIFNFKYIAIVFNVTSDGSLANGFM